MADIRTTAQSLAEALDLQSEILDRASGRKVNDVRRRASAELRRLDAVEKERDRLHASLDRWVRENAPGGWIDQLRSERDALRAEVERAKADCAAALGLVSSIRFALGDNGRRMQSELIEWCRGLRDHAQHLAQLRGESTVLRTLLSQADEVLATIDDQDMEDDSQFRQLRQDIAAALDPSSRDCQQMVITEASKTGP